MSLSVASSITQAQQQEAHMPRVRVFQGSNACVWPLLVSTYITWNTNLACLVQQAAHKFIISLLLSLSPHQHLTAALSAWHEQRCADRGVDLH